MCSISIALFFTAIAFTIALPDENKWVWNDGNGNDNDDDDGEPRNRDEKRARFIANDYNLNSNFGNNPFNEYRPQFGGSFGHGNGPIRQPLVGPNREEVLVGPGGPTGIVNRPSGGREDLLGPEDFRYRQFEICKCSYSFNCPSTGLNFGTCSKGKRYCCYNSNKFPGLTPAGNPSHGSHASYPIRPNFGPVNFLPPNYYGRPQGNFHGDYLGHLSGHYRPDDINYGRPYGGRPYGPDRYENQRPFNLHHDEGDFYSRSANKDPLKDDASATKKSIEN
ncbi:uncharacterized protein LOC122499050 isoform X1 [Leptopilina heterotoma]|uniref:uncharacterized protein LOC122499050 isoform X1 n=1 Tax=Leptopilina heterotoma TaxID=63436 RepID=UPI001CAA2ECB|nr:uncharacterized protein LOC122499050 isoform X1 [Leptopilina heterotoma]